MMTGNFTWNPITLSNTFFVVRFLNQRLQTVNSYLFMSLFGRTLL